MTSKTMKYRIGCAIVNMMRVPRRDKRHHVLHFYDSDDIKMNGQPIMRRLKNLKEFHAYFDRMLANDEDQLRQHYIQK